MRARVGSWLRLVLGLVLLAAFVVMLHRLSARMTGDAGALIARNQAENLEVYAYFYSEVGDIGEFLDDERGRYGECSLRVSLQD